VPKTEAMLQARRRTRVILGVAVLLAVLLTLGMWLRDSSLVRVDHVTVTGIEGPQARAIRFALTEAARDMSVLHVRDDALRTAVEPYPVVRSLRTTTDFPHGLTIAVNAYEPVAALKSGTDLTPVAADGTVLRGSAASGLAVVNVSSAPGGGRVHDPRTLRSLGLLAAAPAPLRARISHIFRGPHGLAATLENGPKLYFGGSQELAAKWGAAAAVLAHATSRGAGYVDLRIPERPVAGGLKPRTPEAQPQL
jgi:cell division protein FtsQ